MFLLFGNCKADVVLKAGLLARFESTKEGCVGVRVDSTSLGSTANKRSFHSHRNILLPSLQFRPGFRYSPGSGL